MDTETIIEYVNESAWELLYLARKQMPRRAVILEEKEKYEDCQLCARCKREIESDS